MAAAHPAAPQSRQTPVLGIVGGSGLYEMEALQEPQSRELDTPFGRPSGPFTVGLLPRKGGEPLRAVFVARHGTGHRLLPSEINYRANIHGLKQLGVTHLLSVSAVGSLREEIEPGHVVFPDQLIDRTRQRAGSFFGDGVVGHVQFGEPTTPAWRGHTEAAARRAGATVHTGGTLIVMEGPGFSTRAESELYRAWGAHIIGMTALPEARLAREAEMAYALMALSTDYDCWHQGHDEVSVDAVVAVIQANVQMARRTVVEVAAAMPSHTDEIPYPRACENAVMTAPDAMPAEARERLDLIIGHYLASQD